MEEKGMFNKIKNKFKNLFSGIGNFLNSNEVEEIENGKLNTDAFEGENPKTLKMLNEQLSKTSSFGDNIYSEKQKHKKLQQSIKTDKDINVPNTSRTKNRTYQKGMELE